MGRGGAFVAGADDISAQWYNPSALTRIHGTHFRFEVAGIKQQIYFDRTDYGGVGPKVNGEPTDLINEPIRNTAPPLPIPHFGLIHDFGNPNLTILLGFTTPHATDIRFPKGGAQRYSLEDSVVIHTYTGPAIAYQVSPRLSLGFGTSWNYMIVGQEMQVALQVPFEPCNGTTEDPQCDVGLDSIYQRCQHVYVECRSDYRKFRQTLCCSIDVSTTKFSTVPPVGSRQTLATTCSMKVVS